MTIRELCSVIGSALHVPDVQRWAAPLVRAGLLPRAGAEVDVSAAAVLLLAVAAAPDPKDAPRIVAGLGALPLLCLERNDGSLAFEKWAPATEEDLSLVSPDPGHAVAWAIESASMPADTEGKFQFGRLRIEEGGVNALLHGWVLFGGVVREYRALYAMPGPGISPPLRRLVEIQASAINAVADALTPADERIVTHEAATLTLH